MFDEIVALESVTARDSVRPGLVLLQSPQESLRLISAAVQRVTVEDASSSPAWLRCLFTVVERCRAVEHGPLSSIDSWSIRCC